MRALVKNAWNNKTSKRLYSLAIASITILILIVLNLIFRAIPSSLDLTKRSLFSLSSESKELLADLDQELKIYLLFKNKIIPTKPIDISNILARYRQANSLIKIINLNSDTNPEVLRKFNTQNKPLRLGSIVVSSGEKFRVLYWQDLFTLRKNNNSSIKVEELLGNAISYVLGAELPELAFLLGHAEEPPAANGLDTLLVQRNFRLSSLNLEQQAIGASTKIIVANMPQYDLSAHESQKLKDFLLGGGSLYVIFDYQFEQRPNWDALLADFNLEVLDGVVVERASGRLDPSNPQPSLFAASYDTSAQGLASKEILLSLQRGNLNPFFAYPMGIASPEIQKRSLSFEKILTSSPSSFLRIEKRGTRESRGSSDLPGPITLFATVNETNSRGERTGLSIALTFSIPLRSKISIGSTVPNRELFAASVEWLSKREQKSVSIASKSKLQLPMSIPLKQAIIWGAVFILLIPLSIVLTAIIVLFHRYRL